MSAVLAFRVPPGKPVLRGIDHYWRIIRDLDSRGPWTASDVWALCGGGIDRGTVRDYIRRLVAGDIACIAEGRSPAIRYRLRRSPADTPRLRRDGTATVQGRGQSAMWNMMRGPLGRTGFTAAEVALYATTSTVRVTEDTAKSYVKHLAQAGYLVTLRKGRPGRQGEQATYRLKPGMHTGRLPPLILRSQIVYDQNLGEVVGPVEAREVEP